MATQHTIAAAVCCVAVCYNFLTLYIVLQYLKDYDCVE